MINVLDRVREEKEKEFEYPDQRIASNVYYVSLSKNLKALAGMKDAERIKCEGMNEWLRKETAKVNTVPILDFDNIIQALNNQKKSCDGLFYDFSLQEGRQHYLAEFKNAGKKEMLEFLKISNPDGIYHKVSDTIQSIKNQLEFGGTQEKEEMIKHTHLFIVYEGKNNIPVQNNIKLPGKVSVCRDSRNKQKKAGKMDYATEKVEGDIYTQFGKKILELGLQECSEDAFPGEALPRASRAAKGKGKVRAFSIFSAKNFADIIENGFFDQWNWGEYTDSFVE